MLKRILFLLNPVLSFIPKIEIIEQDLKDVEENQQATFEWRQAYRRRWTQVDANKISDEDRIFLISFSYLGAAAQLAVFWLSFLSVFCHFWLVPAIFFMFFF